MSVIVKDKAGETIYACVGVLWNGSSWTYSDTVYVSADCQQSARVKFQRRFQTNYMREVAIAPAVGWKVLDNHGEKLLA